MRGSLHDHGFGFLGIFRSTLNTNRIGLKLWLFFTASEPSAKGQPFGENQNTLKKLWQQSVPLWENLDLVEPL
jgi:hypothetical protein